MAALSPYPYDTAYHEPEPVGYALGAEPPDGNVLTQQQVEREYTPLTSGCPRQIPAAAGRAPEIAARTETPHSDHHCRRRRRVPAAGLPLPGWHLADRHCRQGRL